MVLLNLITIFYLLFYLNNSNTAKEIRPTDCLLPASPMHGNYTEINMANQEKTIKFSCEPNAYLMGNKTLTCNSGKWNDTLPICVTRNFKNLTMEGKDLTNLTDNNYTTCVHLGNEALKFDFTCEDNINSFVILRVIHDQKTADVEHFPEKNFQKYCHKLNNEKDSKFVIHNIKCDISAGKMTTFEFYRTLRRICEVELYWQTNYSCPMLNILSEKGSVRYEYNYNDKINYGTAAIYNCKSRYKISGESIRYCKYGRWTGNETTCKETGCGNYTSVENGQILYTNKSTGGTATLKCNTGYKRVSSIKSDIKAVSLCLPDDTWTPISFKCEEINCPDLPTNIEGTNWIYRSPARIHHNATIKCHTNFALFNEPSMIKCLQDGTWSKTTAFCKDISSSLSNTNMIVIAASIGAGSSAFIFGIILCIVILRKRFIKTRNRITSDEQDQVEGNEYFTIVYDQISSVKDKKPTSPLPKLPSCETEFNYSEPIDKNKNTEKGSQYMYTQPQDAIRISNVDIRHDSIKRRNSSADSTYWRDCGEFDDKVDVFKPKGIPSNFSLPDFSITRSLIEDLYSSD